jgi:RimJ/RimL family protein N-acetyltransferase
VKSATEVCIVPLQAPIEITRPPVRLRRMIAADGPALGDFLALRENTRFMTFPPDLRSAEAGPRLVALSMDAYQTPGAAFALAVCSEDNADMVGACGASEREDGRIEIFYLVFAASRRRGIAIAAASALVDHLAAAAPNRTLIAFIHPENAASLAVMRRLGFRDQGATCVNGLEGREFVRAIGS